MGDGFGSDTSEEAFDGDSAEFAGEADQVQLLVECQRAARLLLRLQMHRIHRQQFDPDAIPAPGLDVPPPLPAGMPPMPFLSGAGPAGSAAFFQNSPQMMRGQGRLLYMLSKNDGVLIKDIVEALDIRPSSASELVAKLEKKGLIRVEGDEADKRVRKVFLTAEGKELTDQMDHRYNDLFDGLSEDEQAQLLTLLQKMNSSLNEKSLELDRLAQDEVARRHQTLLIKGKSGSREPRGMGRRRAAEQRESRDQRDRPRQRSGSGRGRYDRPQRSEQEPEQQATSSE